MSKLIISLLLAGIALAAPPSSATAAKSQGTPSAPIQIEVFSDFECPHCKMLFEETLRPLVADLVAKGKVYLIHRDYPLPMHQKARLASAYANAAARLNKYELVCAELFRQQAAWSANGQIDATVAGVLNAEEMKKVRPLLSDKSILAETEQDLALGNQHRISQTPTLIITYKGRDYTSAGFVTYPILRRYLDDLLNK